MKANIAQLVREKRDEIKDIVLQHPHIAYYYKARTVRLFGCFETDDSDEVPAVDILVCFDQPNEHDLDLIVCFRKHPPRPRNKKHPYSFPPDVELAETLGDLLSCTTTVCSEEGLMYYYPITYSKTLLTHGWDF